MKYIVLTSGQAVCDFFNEPVYGNLFHVLMSCTIDAQGNFHVFYQDRYNISMLPEEGYIDEEDE